MDEINLILNSPVLPPSPLEKIAGEAFTGAVGRVGSPDEPEKNTEKLEQLAKDFESVLLTKLLDEMKETVGKSGLEEEDAAAGQVQGLFWLYLAKDISDKGGLGLWKDLKEFFTDMQNKDNSAQSLDAKI